MATTLMLRKRGTDEVFLYTELLMKRGDMELITPDAVPQETPAGSEVPAADVDADWREITSKPDLEAFARNKWGLELDKRKSLTNMRADVLMHLQTLELAAAQSEIDTNDGE